MRTTLLLLLTLGCAPPLPPPAHTLEAPLVSPWDLMGLPLDGAKVRYADADTVTVVHPGPTTTAAIADRYAAALTARGLTVGRRVDATTSLQQDFAPGDRSLSLALRVEGDSLIASLAWVPQ
jgi:hypothetical protein